MLNIITNQADRGAFKKTVHRNTAFFERNAVFGNGVSVNGGFERNRPDISAGSAGRASAGADTTDGIADGTGKYDGLSAGGLCGH